MSRDDKGNSPLHSPISRALGREEILLVVLSFADEHLRETCTCLSKYYHQLLTSDQAYHWRCERLHTERGICHPSKLQPEVTWKSTFFSLWKIRDLWEKKTHKKTLSVVTDDKFYIQVSARFKPKGLKSNNEAEQAEGTNKKVVLPLHQRLALLKMDKNLSSKKEAFKILVERGEWCIDSKDETRDDGQKIQNTVLTGGVKYIDVEKKRAVLVDKMKGLREFKFDNILSDQCSQQNCYETSTKVLIGDFLNGMNVTTFVYGQTGSGKTFTMFGPDTKPFMEDFVSERWGIVPRACSEVFRTIEFRNKHLNLPIEADVAISYIEIYGNEVKDLLRNGIACGHSKVAAQRYVTDGSSEIHVKNLAETFSLLNQGEKQKRKAATAMNDRSSRAHSLLILTLRQKNPINGIELTSRLYLVDLGGSEQLKKSQPFQGTRDQSDSHLRVEEAVNINLGLLSLKQCVESLRKKKTHIPYQNSKLTMILSEGLGGKSKTSVIVCGAQEGRHGAETIDALKFGQACLGVSNTANANVKMVEDLLQTIDQKIAECQEKIRLHERWETMDEKEFSPTGTLLGVRHQTVLVGAEQYHEQLNSLLEKRKEITA